MVTPNSLEHVPSDSELPHFEAGEGIKNDPASKQLATKIAGMLSEDVLQPPEGSYVGMHKSLAHLLGSGSLSRLGGRGMWPI
jgi:hypothetical protein